MNVSIHKIRSVHLGPVTKLEAGGVSQKIYIINTNGVMEDVSLFADAEDDLQFLPVEGIGEVLEKL